MFILQNSDAGQLMSLLILCYNVIINSVIMSLLILCYNVIINTVL